MDLVNLHGPALVTLFTAVLHVWLSWMVGKTRARTGVHAPATSGHPEFERVFRAQANTVESTVIFLPTLWVAALYSHAGVATALGCVWLVSRVWYALAYRREAEARHHAFVVSAIAGTALIIQGFTGVVRVLAG